MSNENKSLGQIAAESYYNGALYGYINWKETDVGIQREWERTALSVANHIRETEVKTLMIALTDLIANPEDTNQWIESAGVLYVYQSTKEAKES